MVKNVFRATTLAVILTTVIVLLPGNLTFAHEAGTAPVPTARQQEPITAREAEGGEVTTLDPQLASDEISVNPIENLFMGLTDNNPSQPGNIMPELATSWTYNTDGTVWTFTLRDDVPWVHWDPVNHTGEVVRMVTAGDVVYGVRRACDPRLNSIYGASMVAQIVKGCDKTWAIKPGSFTDADLDMVQVKALDDTTVQFTLNYGVGYFLNQTSLWVMRPVPRETVEQYGDHWTDVGNIVTNGPYLLDELVTGKDRVFVRNPFLPKDLAGPGNVKRVQITVVGDIGTMLTLYQQNQLDITSLPPSVLQSALSGNLSSQVKTFSDMGVFYVGFTADKPPFDDVHLRRAFSASIDRQAFVQQVNNGLGDPMIHFTPPNVFGAPPIDQVGAGYNPDYARQELAQSNYPDCQGLPKLEIWLFGGGDEWAKFINSAVTRELGCPSDLFTIESSVPLDKFNRDLPAQDRPNMWTLGWLPDYLDANNYVNDVLYCTSKNDYSNRPCSAVDDLILQAARAQDSQTRVELYSAIEDALFGTDGVFPIIPLYMERSYALVQPWYTGPFETDGLVGGRHWNYYSIDQPAQVAALSR
jgi:oligopeptide transport system substrate-binding protein